MTTNISVQRVKWATFRHTIPSLSPGGYVGRAAPVNMSRSPAFEAACKLMKHPSRRKLGQIIDYDTLNDMRE